ncbi:MAG: nuclear transport factor 2 family protein [Flammeovirgaceae bacterium]|nr:nuclear transport factor 2 family protein [Flammeovirgaceae bacterium]
MKSCYHPNIHFSDPVFPDLNGQEVGRMWGMLIDALKKSEGGWKLTFSGITTSGDRGKCRWEAHYVFSGTGRKIHNLIDAEFTFKDGKIIGHTDRFDFYRWARMAFGVKGLALGWTPFFKKKVQATVARRLEKIGSK